VHQSSVIKNIERQFLPLSSEYLHPLTFIRPDVILHVFELWNAGTHSRLVERMFSLPDIEKFRPFAMMGGWACVEFIKNWKIHDEDIAILKQLESLNGLDSEFWTFLGKMTHFSGRISALPDGTIMRSDRITVTPEVREMFDSRHVPLYVLMVEGPASEVALISEGLATILDFSLTYSARLFEDKDAKQFPMFYTSERELHPYWARLASTIESLLGVQNPLNVSADIIWLWIDDERDSQLRGRADRAASALRYIGRDPRMLIRQPITPVI
jgi:hypothetical protein